MTRTIAPRIRSRDAVRQVTGFYKLDCWFVNMCAGEDEVPFGDQSIPFTQYSINVTLDGKNCPLSWFDSFKSFLINVVQPAGGRGSVAQEAGSKKGQIHLQSAIEVHWLCVAVHHIGCHTSKMASARVKYRVKSSASCFSGVLLFFLRCALRAHLTRARRC